MFCSKAIASAAAVIAGILCSSVAMASPDCTKESKDKWLTEEAMKAKIADMGYTFGVFKVEGSCYEIYGNNKDGKVVEVYFNPVTGEIVEEEVGD
jgi:hypothetical protein